MITLFTVQNWESSDQFSTPGNTAEFLSDRGFGHGVMSQSPCIQKKLKLPSIPQALPFLCNYDGRSDFFIVAIHKNILYFIILKSQPQT